MEQKRNKGRTILEFFLTFLLLIRFYSVSMHGTSAEWDESKIYFLNKASREINFLRLNSELFKIA